MWVWVAAAGGAATVAVVVGWRLVRVRRALVAERAARRLSDAAWDRELAAIEADVARFVARVRAEIAGQRAREEALAEAGQVVDRAWARHEQQETDGGGSDG